MSPSSYRSKFGGSKHFVDIFFLFCEEEERHNATLSPLHFFLISSSLPSWVPRFPLASTAALPSSSGPLGVLLHGRAESTPYVIAICNSILNLPLVILNLCEVISAFGFTIQAQSSNNNRARAGIHVQTWNECVSRGASESKFAHCCLQLLPLNGFNRGLDEIESHGFTISGSVHE